MVRWCFIYLLEYAFTGGNRKQLELCMWRSYKMTTRNYISIASRILNLVVVGLVLGTLFVNLGKDQASVSISNSIATNEVIDDTDTTTIRFSVLFFPYYIVLQFCHYS